MARPKRRADESTGSLFEENYLVRTLGRIAQDSEVALTELVANAWDACASLVDLTIPTTRELILTVEDDGHGMTAALFRGRWIKLGYDRTKNQSSAVEFPPERKDWRRSAYGRNEVGRHGLLCFASRNSVETWREDTGASFEIGTQSQETTGLTASDTAAKIIDANHTVGVARLNQRSRRSHGTTTFM